MNLDSVLGGTQPYESEKILFIQQAQCVPFEGCKLIIPISLENGPSPKKIQFLCLVPCFSILHMSLYYWLHYFLKCAYEQNH